MKINNLNDLKTFLNTLNEEQLQQQAILHLVDEGSERIEDALISEDDEYLTDEGWAPVNTFEPEDDDDRLESYPIRKAGWVYLFND